MGAYIAEEPAVGTAQPASGFEAHFLVGGWGEREMPTLSSLPATHILSRTESASPLFLHMYKACRVSDGIMGKSEQSFAIFGRH